MHFTGTKSSPYILLLLKYKKCSARMEAMYHDPTDRENN